MSKKSKKISRKRNYVREEFTPNIEYINEKNIFTESNDSKDETRFSFYSVKTNKRSFFVNSIDEIKENLLEDEKSFFVTNIEYICEFKGQEDVLKISNSTTNYMTHMGINSSMEYDEVRSNELGKEIWKSSHFNNLSGYYAWIRKNGINLRNDAYKRDDELKEFVYNLLK